MKLLFSTILLLVSFNLMANESDKEWEALDLEETHLKEMEEEHRRQYEDREGDLQIQAEEEEIIPLESEDSREFSNKNNQQSEDY
ncbi:MAG: hypothetical protein WCY48_02955 [Candidatus Caldatribacteriota bacterium]